MKYIILLLVLSPSPANAATIKLNLASYHFERCACNEINGGVGLSAPLNDNFIEVGTYNNSNYKTSNYALFGRAYLHGDFKLASSFGFATGYYPHKYMPVIVCTISAYGFNFSFTPKVLAVSFDIIEF